jgi:antitoxin (DNA-binding transcriptional repressor) of toxin-antitoxin stability system
MKSIKIREMRGAKLEEAARAGELVGLTRDRALIAVVVPMVQAWVEHIVDQNWSRILQSAASAEDLIAAEARLTTLDDIDDAPDADTDHDETSERAPLASQPVAPPARTPMQSLAAEAVRATEELGPAGAPAAVMIRRLSEAFGLVEPDDTIRSTSVVGIRQLSARRIEQAGHNRELLVLTNGRLLVGIVVAVTQRLVEFLVSQNLSRVLYNIGQAESTVAAGEPFTTLDSALAAADKISAIRGGEPEPGG